MLTGKKVGEEEWDHLIYDLQFPFDTTFVKLKAGQKELPRGSVVTDEGHLFDGTGKAFFILAEDTDTGEDGTASPVLGLAYRSGHFNRNALTLKDGAKLKDADELDLRTGGIYLSTSME